LSEEEEGKGEEGKIEEGENSSLRKAQKSIQKASRLQSFVGPSAPVYVFWPIKV
jgi:hypothetical protein